MLLFAAEEGFQYAGALEMLGVAALILVVPFIVGSFLGRRLRMPDYGWKIGVCLASLMFGALVTYLGWRDGRIKKGIDLSGGVDLIYQIDPKDEKAKTADRKTLMESLVAALTLRVNPGGVKEVTIRQYGADEVEIIIPEVDPTEARRIKELIETTGSLEFRILANRKDHEELIKRAEKSPAREIRDGDTLRAWWVPVKKGEERGIASYPEIARREGRDRNGEKVMEVLVVKDNYDVTGRYLTHSAPGTDKNGRPCVTFAFDTDGASRFGGLTGANLPDEAQKFTRKLAIILDNYIYSAPSIQSTIHDRGEITGSFTQEEVQHLVDVLNAGALPATLLPDPTEQNIGPTLGSDTIARSAQAILIAAILVPIFMLWYYRMAGMVANLALAINILAIIAVMMSVKAAFTLSGLAGLALTMGMAVDNNVLVFERLREERAHGATLRMAIRNAFARASAVIIDSNVTTLIAAVVLYIIGTDQVRGFAVTLFLGVSISMFTSVWVSRVIFDIAERQKWITDLTMMQIIGVPKIDFMRWFPLNATLSVLMIVVGLAATFWRGVGILDIDFTGGASVQVYFQKPHDSGEIRGMIAKQEKDLPDAIVTDVQFGSEEPGRRFVINTSNQDQKDVQAKLEAMFAGELVTNSVQASDYQTIAAAKPDAEKKAEKEGEEPADAFAGGTQVDLNFAVEVNHDTVRDYLRSALKTTKLGDVDRLPVEVTNAAFQKGDKKAFTQWTMKIALPQPQTETVVKAVDQEIGGAPVFPRSGTIKSNVAASTRLQAIYALIASWACMLVYLWIRFQGVAFGLAAVVALIHDVLVMLGMIALSYWLATPLKFMLLDPYKINLTMVAAFLTIIGYSVNDTIIVFDRIREVRGKMPYITPPMVNDSVNQTLSRTLITSFTVLLVCVVLYFLGGDAMRGMAFGLIVGIISGTYSSIYVAAPILLWLVKPKHVKFERHSGGESQPAK